MDNLFNIPSNAIKTVDKLLQNFREETIDEVEESFKNLKKKVSSTAKDKISARVLSKNSVASPICFFS